MRLAKKLCNN